MVYPFCATTFGRHEYYKMADDLHVDAILHTCTLAACLVDYLRQFFATPIVRLDEGMARKAVAVCGKAVVFGTMQLSIDNHLALIRDIADKEGNSINITGHLLCFRQRHGGNNGAILANTLRNNHGGALTK